MKKSFAFLLIILFCTLSSTLSVACSGHVHSYSSEWTTDETHHWHQATCEHSNFIIDKASHSFSIGVVTEATFESAGFTTYQCTICNHVKQVPGEPQLEHNFSTTLTHDNGNTHWYACIDTGYESLKNGESTHDLSISDYDSTTGYATYSCVCGFSKRFLSSSIVSLPSIVENTAFIGQPLYELSLLGGAGNVDGSFSWSAPNTIITQSGYYSVTFTPADTVYAPVTDSIYVTATQLSVSITTGENGFSSPSGIVNVNYGESLTINFTPDSGYVIDTIMVDGQSVEAHSSYTFSYITDFHTVSVEFCVDPTDYDLPFSLTYVSGTQGCYTYQDSVLTFTAVNTDTVYAISGELDGSIVIDVGDDYKFDLELTGFSLSSTTTNPITILSGNEVSITAKNGYKNYVTDNRPTIDSTDTTVYSASIYSLIDLEICGKGELYLTSTNNNGIHTKDDLQVKNLTLSVSCVDNALKGNDGVKITNANTTLIATQGDCIKSTNNHVNATTSNQKGTISIAGGSHNLYAACDGIDSAYDVLIDDTTTVLNIYTDVYSEYSESITTVTEGVYYVRYSNQNYKYSVKYYNSDTDFIWVNPSYFTSAQSGNKTYYYYSFSKNANYSKMILYAYSSTQAQAQASDYQYCSDSLSHNDSYDTIALSSRQGNLSCSWTSYTQSSSGGMGGMQDGNSDKGTYSTKGIKATNDITINAGIINVKSYDDAIHAGDGDLIDTSTALENGEIPTGNLTINGGTITAYSHDDGLHAEGTLSITQGKISVTKSYEGMEGLSINVSGGEVSVTSSDDGFNSTTTTGAGITISGGIVYVYAGGDGLDSNSSTSKGAIIFSGGDIVVICSSSGNASIDSDGGYTHTAGRVVAIMPTGGMTSEATNGSSSGMTIKSSLSLSNGGYLAVSVNSTMIATIKMPCSMTSHIVYLGSNSAAISSSSSSSASLNNNGVYWA